MCTPVPGIAIWYDFVTPAEEQYLIQASHLSSLSADRLRGGTDDCAAIQKTDAVGGDPEPQQPGPEQDASAQSSATVRDDGGTTATTYTPEAATTETTGSKPRKAWGWKDLNGRRYALSSCPSTCHLSAADT